MRTSYNRIAGQSVERSAALSDGVFAVAMTLLVLDLRAPAVEAVHNEQDLWLALGALAPRLIMCAMTGRPADATEPPDPFGPPSFVDAHPVPVRGSHDAVLHHAAGRLHRLPDRVAGLLGEPAAVGRHSVLQRGCARRASAWCGTIFLQR